MRTGKSNLIAAIYFMDPLAVVMKEFGIEYRFAEKIKRNMLSSKWGLFIYIINIHSNDIGIFKTISC